VKDSKPSTPIPQPSTLEAVPLRTWALQEFDGEGPHPKIPSPQPNLGSLNPFEAVPLRAWARQELYGVDPHPRILSSEPQPRKLQSEHGHYKNWVGWTLTPNFQALNPNPGTLNPQLATLNPQPSTLNP